MSYTYKFYIDKQSADAQDNSFMFSDSQFQTFPNYGISLEVGPSTGIYLWRITNASTGSSPKNMSYREGDLLNNDGNYWFYPNFYLITMYPTLSDALANTNGMGIGDPGDMTIYSFNNYSFFKIASNSTGTSSQLVVYTTGNVLNDDGSYNLYPIPTVTFYAQESDALAQIYPLNSYINSFLVRTMYGISSWRIESTSTGSSSQSNIYILDDVLNNDGVYYMYPSTPVPILIKYYPTEADAIADTTCLETNDGTNLFDRNKIASVYDIVYWKIASNSTGTFIQSNVYQIGQVLDFTGNYYLYPAPTSVNSVTYYPTKANALAGTNSIGTGTSLTVETISGLSSWRIASNSTGTSSQLSVYTVGNVLNDDGNYNLYPTSPITFYAKESDALAEIYPIYYSGTFTVYDGYGISSWRISLNSTGSSSTSITYAQGDLLNNDGLYYMYPSSPVPILLKYYPTNADALADTNSIGINDGTGEVERNKIVIINDIYYWRIASNSTGTSPQSELYQPGQVLNFTGNYYLYAAPIYMNYFLTESYALAKSFINGYAYSESTYIVESFGNIVKWQIASSSTGSSSQLVSYVNPDELNNDGVYYLYPTPAVGIAITYYSTEANAAAKTSDIGTSEDYNIIIVNGIDGWKVHSSSTGSASRSVNWTSGDRINNDGVYYMYPYTSSTNSITYYPTQADALAGTNSIGTGSSLVIETIGGFSSWRIASNSTGTSSKLSVYNTGNTLNNDGNYNLYPPTASAYSITYYPTQTDALAETNSIGTGASLVIETIGGFSSWRIASNSTGTSSKLSVYNTGTVLNDNGNYNLYPAGQTPCFLEGSKILSLIEGTETYLPIEKIKPGTYVKTSLNGYKKVELIGKFEMYNSGNNERIQDKIYKCSVNKYPELKEDLYITGCHSILVDELTDLQREKTIKEVDNIFVTDKKYRLLACIDERAEPWCSEGKYTVYHFAIENNNIKMNYGVYANGGLLVETCSINYMKTKSNMQLIS